MKKPLCLFLAFILSGGPAMGSPYQLIKDPARKRDETNAFVSLLLPGFGQWKEQQTTPAFIYSGLGVAGLSYAVAGFLTDDNSPSFRGQSRHGLVGLSLYTTAGGLSGHHAYRTAVRSMKEHGHYDFLQVEESPLEVALSPFRFDYLLRPTTLLPLAAVAALFFGVVPATSSKSIQLNRVSLGDAAFTGAISYGSGTAEEAIFRGMIMPTLNDRWHRPFVANLATAGLFAAAHIDPDNFFVPWPQFLGGLYFGWVSQHRDWTISESIFIHCWYDVIVLTAAYATSNNGELRVGLPPIIIPF